MSSKDSRSLFSFFFSLWTHRYLLFQLTKREIWGRYKGSVVGILWSLIVPMFMLAIYTYVFSVIFQAKWSHTNLGHGDLPDPATNQFYFAIVLFAGLIIFSLFSEIVTKSPNLVTANPNFVKKTLFPVELLPVPAIAAACFHAGISLLVLLAFCLISGHPIPATFAALPLVILPLLLFCLGLSWTLSAVGVYFRDIQQIVSLSVSVLMFVTPVFYSLSAVPERFHQLVQLNPLTHFVEWARQVMIMGELPSLSHFSIGLMACFLFAWLGFFIFQKMRSGFADVV